MKKKTRGERYVDREEKKKSRNKIDEMINMITTSIMKWRSLSSSYYGYYVCVQIGRVCDDLRMEESVPICQDQCRKTSWKLVGQYRYYYL